MILIYLKSFHNREKQTAIYAEIIETAVGRTREKVKIYPTDKSVGYCEIDMIKKIVPTLSIPETQQITVCTDEHQLAWDAELIRKGEQPDFNSWKEFLDVLEQEKISISKFKVKEGGMMSQAEWAQARACLSRLAESHSEYGSFL